MRTLAIVLCAVAGFVALAPQVASADPCARGQYWDGHQCVVKLNAPPQFRAKFYAPRVHKVKVYAPPRAPAVKFRASRVYTSKFQLPPRLSVKIKHRNSGHYHY